jgi:hypothetical protein
MFLSEMADVAAVYFITNNCSTRAEAGGFEYLLLKSDFFVTHRHTIVLETEKKLDRSSKDQNSSMLVFFFANIRTSNFFCGHNILTEGVFITALSSNAGISF